MKINKVLLFTVLFSLFFIMELKAQGYSKLILGRVEQAFNSRNPHGIEDLFNSSMSIRLEDSLYLNIPVTKADSLLTAYFSGLDSVDFHFRNEGSGDISFFAAGKKKTLAVDIYFGNNIIYKLNISNYPSANAFFRLTQIK